jgi:hypothetical protein
MAYRLTYYISVDSFQYCLIDFWIIEFYSKKSKELNNKMGFNYQISLIQRLLKEQIEQRRHLSSINSILFSITIIILNYSKRACP